ncbi:MAG: glyoxylate/hydroxypyruvate reductase A [Azospirillaceae bacterium]|nr:glyoxylate/hydroxypyruvate reductase A [Azospirillaceae bacterium]
MPLPRGVYLSTSLDLAAFFGDRFRDLDIRTPEAIDDPAAIRFAIAWEPAADAFTAYPGLQFVSSLGAGVDSILACPSLPDIPVVRVRDPEQARLMAGFVAWTLLWWTRRFGEHRQNQRLALWQRLPVNAPSHIRVGILGFGLMGQATARTLHTLGFPIRAVARSSRRAEAIPGVTVECGPGALTRVAAASDVLINLLPLTRETRGILGDALFAAMPQGAILIHAGRGEQLDEGALLAALDRDHLGGAAIDVFAQEPLPADHPFWAHERILVSPHDAADAPTDTIVAQITDQVRRIAAGEPVLDPIFRDHGY